MDPIQIRYLKLDDINEILRIYSAIIRDKIDLDFKKSIRRQLENPTNEAVSYVADINNKIVGFMMGHILSPSFGMKRSAWIVSFGVDPNYMGQDIGKLLADKIFKFFKLKGVNRVYTSVLWDSTDILSFFKTLGFGRSSFIELQKDLD